MLSPALLTKFLRTARFLPYRRDRPGTLPALSVAGALVFTYVDADGHLCVSIDLDTAHPALVEGPRTRAELSRALGRPEEDLDSPLYGLSMLGYLAREGEGYRLANWFFERWLRRRVTSATR